jgi:2-dehydro-3-deoxygluconokinase
MTPRPIDVLAAGEPLALFDPTDPGPLEDVSGFTLRIAGAELNALIGLSRLGHSTAFVSAVGDDPFGRLVRRTLERERVGTQFLHTGRAPTGVFVKERIGTHGRRVYYYRTRSAASKLRRGSVLHALDEAPPRLVLASGLTLGLGEEEGLGVAAETLLREAHARGIPVVFDPNLRPGIWHGATARDQFASLVPVITHLLAGESELSTLLPDADSEHAAADLLAAGMESVIVKHGRQGSTVYTADGVESVSPIAADAVDAIGAGDAFAAGFVSGLLRDWPVPAAARLGSAMGARAVQGTGDWESLPRGPESDSMIEALGGAA